MGWRAVLGLLASTASRATADQLLGLALLLRLVLIGVAEVQDLLAEVPYTDVDYRVFSDAAGSVVQGLSPYAGRTPLLLAEATRYRYTPLLAYLLLPNVWLHGAWGKVLFSTLDVAAACVLRTWLEQHAGEDAVVTVKVGLCLWLFNPFCFTISTRGSGESVVVLLLYGTLWALHSRRSSRLAAVLFGLAVHWRLYPVVYALPITLSLGAHRRGVWRLLNKEAIEFCLLSAAVFGLLAALFTALYGAEFLEATYLYHGKRLDVKHNFSVYFYPNALHVEGVPGAGFAMPNLARWAALPQLGLCAWLGFAASGPKGGGLALAVLLQTVALVATNKVITAQYFVWWWSLVPLALPWLRWRDRWQTLARAGLVWAAAEVHWLLWAYLLEFREWPVRPGVWGASCLFLGAHMLVLRELRRSATDRRPAAGAGGALAGKVD